MALKLLTMLLLLSAPAVLAGIRFGMPRALGALGVSLVLSGCAGLVTPFIDSLYVKIALGASLLAWAAWIQFAPKIWASSMDILMGTPWRGALFLIVLCTIVPIGNLEWAARFTTGIDLVEYHTPMETRWMNGVEDWREYYVTSDWKREQDSVLFWRSKAGTRPFNAQGFKGASDTVAPKPSNAFRIMAYGDTNTEGPIAGDWSQDMRQILRTRNTYERTYDVVNAGVSGYSSYQGVQRFLREWEEYEPDLVLVSFGWSDLPEALGEPDKTYEAMSPVVAWIMPVLIRYRSYMVIQHYMISGDLEKKMEGAVSRVPLKEYLENMARFAEVGREQGITVVFLTRPYRSATSELLEDSSWRSRAPSYNAALLEFAQSEDEHWIDVQKHFEEDMPGLFGDQTHFTPQGREEMARFMVRELERQGLLPAR